MMAPSKKLLAALAAVFLLNILVIGGVQSLTTPALAAVYQQGSQGETVRQIQTKLKRWGYYDGEVDGIYGSATTEAVKYFQRRNGLTADGIAGNATLQAIGISTGASSSGSESGRDNDLYLMARMISAEARGEPYEGQVAVGAVVINRVLSSVFPNTVSGVIYQSRQFEPVSTGRLALALAENRATDSCYRAADEAMSGYSNVGTCVFFRTPIPGLEGINIGGHVFY